MKRFHVHVAVEDLARSIEFYTMLFGAAPARVEADYAKWLLDDPRVNFAISMRGRRAGVDHLGLEVDSGAELTALEPRLRSADAALVAESATTCCYARADKFWATDPQGVAWEAFHTVGSAPSYGCDAPVVGGARGAPAGC